METWKMLIGGAWRDAASGETRSVDDPATGEAFATVPDAGAEETNDAIEAAAEAQPGWAALPAYKRAERLDELARLMRRDEDELARLMTREQGKPVEESRGEIRYARSFIEWAAGEGPRLYGDVIPASKDSLRLFAIRQPVGVCGIITPWNFPAAMITRKLGPALACGCAAVIKPANATPLSALAIARLCEEAEIPAGLVNVLTGRSSEIGGAMFDHEALKKLSFTGSTEVGSTLIEQSAKRIVNLSLELGGHAPLIVFDDADLDRAVEHSIKAKFRNGGQTCIAANRFYVQAGIYDDFRDRFVERVKELTVGVGTEDGVDVGPMIDDAAIEKIERHIADATSKGARVLCGGERLRLGEGRSDRFFQATVLEGFTHDMELAREETFGPVAPLMKFEKEEEAVRLANDTVYGLAAYFFSENASRLTRVAEALEYGIVGANNGLPSTAQAPFGGYKRSGLGREGGKYVMDEYTETKYISLGIDP